MFVPIKADQYWGYSNSIDDSFIHSKAWMYGDYTHPYYCETNKKWVLVWQPIPYEEAIQASREYYHILPMTLADMSYPHARAMRIDSYSTIESAMARANKRPPIRLWEPTAIDPHVLECLVERADPYHESNFALWEKYPEVAKDGYHVTAHKVLLTNKRLNKHPRWHDKPKTSVSPHDYTNWITFGEDGLHPERGVFGHPLFQQEMTGLMTSFAAVHSLRKRKIQQSTLSGSCVNSRRDPTKWEFLRQQAKAMEQYTQSPGRTPQFPPFDFDRPALVYPGRSQGKSTDIDWAALARADRNPLLIMPHRTNVTKFGDPE